jgi:putative restriction endonuclease
VKFYVGITDYDWFRFLSSIPDVEEVNFWQPGGNRIFKTLSIGEPFLFKLHSPRNFIVGGGFFTHSTILPVSMAWSAFGIRNGARSIDEMRSRIEKYRRQSPHSEDYRIGCILLTKTFFFEEINWLPIPKNWSPNIVQGKTYDPSDAHGSRLWTEVLLRARLKTRISQEHLSSIDGPRYGPPVQIEPRLGQGSFRVIVTDAYQRRCAVTAEKTLPALDAVHIKPFGKNGPHQVNNGVLLRSDIHRLFDIGYVTISKENHFLVSRKIREDYENGRDYYAMHGRILHLPAHHNLRPDKIYIDWHNENVYLG